MPKMDRSEAVGVVPQPEHIAGRDVEVLAEVDPDLLSAETDESEE